MYCQAKYANWPLLSPFCVVASNSQSYPLFCPDCCITYAASYNQILSEKRATAVALYLNSRGVAKERLAAIGDGEAHPVAGNDTAEGRARNRRVEITIDPITK